MTPPEALAFAIDKLTNEIDRDFDGADITDAERAGYQSAVETLAAMLNNEDDAAAEALVNRKLREQDEEITQLRAWQREAQQVIVSLIAFL